MSTRCKALVNQGGGSIAFGSITGAYQNIFSSSVQGRGVVLYILNTLNQDMILSLDSGTTDWIALPAGLSITIDLGANEVEYSGNIAVKNNGISPTSGRISVGVIRSN